MLNSISKIPGQSKIFNIVTVKDLQYIKHFRLSTCLESCWKPYSNEHHPEI